MTMDMTTEMTTEEKKLPGYLLDAPKNGHIYGTLSYNRRSKCWTIKGEPCVTEMAARLFPGSQRRRGEARFTANRRIIGDVNWLMLRYPLEIAPRDRALWENALMQARDYGARKQAANGDITKMPAYNQKLEALLPVLAREIPLKAHAHQANDIFTALRIAREFDLRLTLEHVTEGHLIADELAKEKDVPMAVGPSLTFASKFELQNKSWKTPGVLANAGCHVSIITDNSVIPQQYLPLCAGMAVKAGMDPFDALKAITINPAEHIGVADRVGSLEVGKDADVVITAGSPFEVLTEVKAVFIDGARIEQA